MEGQPLPVPPEYQPAEGTWQAGGRWLGGLLAALCPTVTTAGSSVMPICGQDCGEHAAGLGPLGSSLELGEDNWA